MVLAVAQQVPCQDFATRMQQEACQARGRSKDVVRWLTFGWHVLCLQAMKILDVPQSGSLAGTTSSRNRFGQYRRTRAVPVNPASAAQGTVRARMSANAASWRTLTSAQRAGWKSLGLSITRTDSLGQVYNMNGFMAYCSVNNVLDEMGSAALADAPELDTPDALLTVAITLSTVAFSLAYTVTPMPADTKLFVYASPQVSAGREFNGDFRFLFSSAAAAASPANILAAYTAKFGVPVTGNRIFVSLVAARGGFLSGALVASQVVA